MSTEASLGHAFVVRWATLSVQALDSVRAELNEANVFPVADSDTGTNMYLTLRGGLEALVSQAEPISTDHASDGDLSALASVRTFARGALVGARGNSGIIMSEFLRGFALGMARTAEGGSQEGELSGGPGTGAGLADCLEWAAKAADTAVADPIQGTILTAADSAARAARQAVDDCGDLLTVISHACEGARMALLRSPDDLDVLARSGVLDAGAYGFTLVLEALASALGAEHGLDRMTHAPLPDLRIAAVPRAKNGTGIGPGGDGCGTRGDSTDLAAHRHAHNHGDGEFEVMFLLEVEDREGATNAGDGDVAQGLRMGLREAGESVVVVGGDGVWQAHVHTDDPAAALASVEFGTMRQVCVRHLSDPLDEVPAILAPGLVVGTGSPGLIPDMARAGAVVLLSTPQGWRDEEIRRAVIDAGTDQVVILAPSGQDAASARALGPKVGDVHVEVLETPTDLHAVVALTASAELLDAVPSSSGRPARSGPKHLAVMAEAIDGLGRTVEVHYVAERTHAVGGGNEREGSAAVVRGVLSGAIQDLRGQPGTLGLVLVLHGTEVPADAVDQHVRELQTAFDHEVVTLASGRSDARLRIGIL